MTAAVTGAVAALLVDDGGGVQIFADPRLQEIVHEDDLAYVESLLNDFVKRAKLHPTDLFEQVSSLAVGPIVTHRKGTTSTDSDYLKSFCSNFQQLANAGD
jgi:hypothetical protein